MRGVGSRDGEWLYKQKAPYPVKDMVPIVTDCQEPCLGLQ
jgi:hypothetical protein